MKIISWLVMGALPLAAVAQNSPRIPPVPSDPLELVTGAVEVADSAGSRAAVLDLISRARANYALRNAGQAWDLKIRFTVDSQGATTYDGAWEMEDQFDPQHGLHWTAKSAGGFSMSGIFAPRAEFAEGTSSAIPLRLHEARAMLYDPLPSIPFASSGSIRTSTVDYRGAMLTCILLSRTPAASTAGRGWYESEDCIDRQSGLLQTHSDVPGRYAVYDYSDAVRIDGHVMPRTVTVSEAGRVVSTISVDSLEPRAAIDANLFAPSARMRSAGRATAMTAATKISRVHSPSPATSSMTVRPVWVFGLVNADGKLVEAHSLQPSDPNSDAAVRDAKSIDFSANAAAGSAPQQHFVFVMERFVTAQ